MHILANVLLYCEKQRTPCCASWREAKDRPKIKILQQCAKVDPVEWFDLNMVQECTC